MPANQSHNSAVKLWPSDTSQQYVAVPQLSVGPAGRAPRLVLYDVDGVDELLDVREREGHGGMNEREVFGEAL